MHGAHRGLLNAGIRESEVAVISPYNGQVKVCVFFFFRDNVVGQRCST